MKKANVQEFTLHAAGGENMPGTGNCHDRAVTHHLIKFHPMDEEYVSEWPPFWNFRKERPPVQKWKGKKKVSDMEQVEPERETGDWKWPWMISRQDDHEFEKAFIARREKEERSSNSILIHCTLGRSKVRVVDAGNKDVTNLPPEKQRQKDALQKILDDNFNQCTRLACGPGTDVFAVKSRGLDDKRQAITTEYHARVSSSHLSELRRLKQQEVDEAAKFVHSFKVKQPNGSMTWKNADMKCQVGTVQNLKVIEEGRRQHAYFFLESKEGGFHLHPVHGELWNARKHVKAPKMDEKTKDETEGLSAAQRKKDREMQRVKEDKLRQIERARSRLIERARDVGPLPL